MFTEWQNNQPITMSCIEKWHETADTVTIKLALTDSQTTSFDFKPGQFISLGIEIDGQMAYRAYSLSSVPGESSLLLTVKRVEGGLVSNYIIDKLAVNDSLAVLKPAGEFNNIDHPAKVTNGTAKAVFISAGSGITPVYSMAKSLLNQQVANQESAVAMTFLHIAKDTQRTIFFDELVTLDATHENFKLQLLLKDAGDTAFPQGRLNQDLLNELVPNINDATVYLCGPSQFMLDVEKYLAQSGFDMDYFFHESFTPAAPAETEVSTETTEETASDTVEVYVPAFDARAEVAPNSVLADSLEQTGAPLIVACRSGICGSCKCKVTKGDVTSTSQETLTPEEIEQGYVLACSSTVQSDVEVELG